MEITVGWPGCIEGLVKVVENVVQRYYEKRYLAEAHTGVLIAKNN